MAAANLYFILITFGQVLKAWWWIIIPFILWRKFFFLYLFWRRSMWLRKQQRVVLEIKFPKEILKPIRAMEIVLGSIHASIYAPPDWWEKFVDGQVQTSMALEIASIEGHTHFYMRFLRPFRDAVESCVYSQYPNAEITEVEDYTKNIPQNIPNKEWEMWGSDYFMLRDDHYPLKTYRSYETEREVMEEKRTDPAAQLLETLSKMGPGEQFWIQILAEPVADAKETGFELKAWIDKGKALRDKLARRPATPTQGSLIKDVANVLIMGQPPAEKKIEKDIIPPEMKLTPGEKDILAAIEEKMSKPIFNTSVRFIYLGKKEVFFKPKFRLGFSFFNSFTTLNLNAIYPLGKTISKIKKSYFLPINLLRPRRLYLRNRKMLRRYVRRDRPFFPRPGGLKREVFVLNTEELASIYHFPGELVASAPGAPRISAKKQEGPANLPI